MKKHLLLALVALAPLAQAKEISGIRHLNSVHVKSVQLEAAGEHGFPQTTVKAIAVFSNSCTVPRQNELVIISNYSENFDNLDLALGNESKRMCPAVYMPVTVTINLGTYTKPNDGLFDRITVNGVEGR